MSIEKVRAYFRSLGIEERVQEFPVSSATVELAAQALGVAPQRIAKTLSFKGGGAGGPRRGRGMPLCRQRRGGGVLGRVPAPV